MSGYPMKGMLLRTCAAAAVTALLAGTAQAQVTQIYGGGSSLAGPTYNKEFTSFANSVDPTINFNYVTDSSGKGFAGFLNDDPTQHGYPAGTTIAYGAADAFLSSAQISGWASSPVGQTAAGDLIQLPMFGTPITIPYNLATQKGNGSIKFTDAQLCGIFSGKFTNFSQLTGINAVGRPPSGPITVFYRGDSSGTSFLMTQHLAAVCSPATSNVTFTATTTFAANFATVPSNFKAVTGSSGIQAGVLGTVGGVGYLSPDYTQVAPVNSGNAAFPVVASVVNGHNGATYTPTSAATETALATAPAPSTEAELANPAAFVPSVPNPGTGYPIVGFTNWDLAQCYADPNVAGGMAEFLFNHFSGPQFGNIITQNGFSLVPTAFVTAINDNIVNNNNGYNLDIGDPTACAGKPGR